MTDPIHAPKPSLLNRAVSALKGKSPTPGPVVRQTRPVGAAAHNLVEPNPNPKVSKAPPAVPAATTPAATTAAPAIAAPAAPADTRIIVSLATLQAMHDQLISHAATLAALFPAGTAEAEAANAAQTAARLKQQTAGK